VIGGWAARRFWKAADARREEDAWTVYLDGRPIRTPDKRPLALPTRAMATAIAEEWMAQGDVIDPTSMPVTRAANSAIDKVRPHKDDVVAALLRYGETDLLCYRAEGPQALSMRQSAAWDPILDWAEQALGSRLVAVAGVMPRPQDQGALDRLAAEAGRMDPFDLTGFHDLVTLSGSLVLGLAVVRGRLAAPEAWEASRVDEEFQAELWGHDAEAEKATAIRRDAFLAAERFMALNRSES
jgi:chaperone required for assembly of F1-ATPase